MDFHNASVTHVKAVGYLKLIFFRLRAADFVAAPSKMDPWMFHNLNELPAADILSSLNDVA